jgi:hypothetical protein
MDEDLSERLARIEHKVRFIGEFLMGAVALAFVYGAVTLTEEFLGKSSVIEAVVACIVFCCAIYVMRREFSKRD